MDMDVHRANPGLTSRTRSEAASAASGVHFFWLLFFVQAKKSDPLARMRAENEGMRPQANQEQSHWIPAKSMRE
jgi:hypothetical protein